MKSLTDSEKQYLIDLIKDDPPVFELDNKGHKIPIFKIFTEAQKFNLILKLNNEE